MEADDVFLLGLLVERFQQSSELSLQVLSASVQLGPQLLSVGSHFLLDLLGLLVQLGLKALGQGHQGLLEVFQALRHFVLHVLGQGDHLALQLVHGLIQLAPQLLALLHQDGLQGLGVHGLGIGHHLLLQLLHLHLKLDHHVGQRREAGAHAGQLPLQAGLQLLGLLGHLGHEVLSQRGHLGAQSSNVLVDGVGALSDPGAEKTTKLVLQRVKEHVGSISRLCRSDSYFISCPISDCLIWVRDSSAVSVALAT